MKLRVLGGAVAVAAVLSLVGAGVASADPPPPPKFTLCHHPPGNPENTQTIEVGSLAAVAAHLAHGDSLGACSPNGGSNDNDRIVVTNEPPGANCAAGGVKLVLIHGKLDEAPAPPTLQNVEPPPPPDPQDETFFICNGLPGAQGPPGPPGPPGKDGVTTIITQPAPKVCHSSVRLGVRFFLPSRFASFKRVQLTIRGPNTTNVRFNKFVPVKTPKFGQGTQKFIFVPLRDRNCGAYTLVVSRPGVAPVAGLWTITGRFGLKRQQIAV